MNKLKKIVFSKDITSNCLAENLTNLLNSFQISENKLAKSLGIPYNTIKRILSGVTSDPRLSTLELIADYFGITLDNLLNKNSETHSSNMNVPILNWEIIKNSDILNTLNCNKFEEWISVAQLENASNTNEMFALKSTKSMQPRFPLGTTFVISPTAKPIDGDLILIRFKSDNSVSLRELVIDSPNWQLNAVISGSESILFNHIEHTIVGIVLLTLIQTRPI